MTVTRRGASDAATIDERLMQVTLMTHHDRTLFWVTVVRLLGHGLVEGTTGGSLQNTAPRAPAMHPTTYGEP